MARRTTAAARKTTAATARKRLDRLRATWKTTGTVLHGKSAGKTFRGRDSYEWLPGDAFLLHRWDIAMPDGRKRGIEVFGFDKATGTVVAHAFDSDGNASRMTVEFAGDTFRLAGEGIRFSGRWTNDDSEIVGRWQLESRGEWTDWMDIRLSRSSARS